VKKAKLYVQKGCPICAEAKAYLKSRGFEVEERSIDEIPISECNLAPVVEINGRRMCGFNAREIEKLLEG
jgi:glutaredoxin